MRPDISLQCVVFNSSHSQTHATASLLPPQTVVGQKTVSGIGNLVRLDDNLVWVLKWCLGPHADSPSGSGGFNDGVVWLSGSLAVKVVDLSDRVGSLQDFYLGLGGSLTSVLGPPHDLDGFDIVWDGKGLDGTEAAFGDGSLHGVLGVGVPDVLLKGGEFLGALERWDFGTENGREFVGSSGGNLECLLSLGEGKHGLEGSLVSVLKVDVHHVEETDRTFPAKSLKQTCVENKTVRQQKLDMHS